MKKPDKNESKRGLAKKPYITPQLLVHGDLKENTGVKAGDKTDGGGKPATRVSGPQA
jgi:hypothetical protein